MSISNKFKLWDRSRHKLKGRLLIENKEIIWGIRKRVDYHVVVIFRNRLTICKSPRICSETVLDRLLVLGIQADHLVKLLMGQRLVRWRILGVKIWRRYSKFRRIYLLRRPSYKTHRPSKFISFSTALRACNSKYQTSKFRSKQET